MTDRLIVLAGNPNVGKSALFSALTGRHARTANYPGTTVEVATGRAGPWRVADAPGLYALEPLSEEERVARETILRADAVVNVVDAVRLERDLALTLELLALGKPMVLAVNMVDEAERLGLRVDAAALSRALGVPAVPTVATRGQGVAELRRLIGTMARRPAGPRDSARAPLSPPADPEARRRLAAALAASVTARGPRRPDRRTVLAAWTVRPFPGLLIAALLAAVTYWLLGVAVARLCVDLIQRRLMEGFYIPLIAGLVGAVWPPGTPWHALLVGDYGILTMPVTYMVAIIFPLLGGFYLVLGVLEDSGYLPRLAALLDRAFRALGLNGRAVIPFILGFGCVTLATLATRALPTRRERLIATFLLALAVPCSAQAAVVAALLARHGAAYLAGYAAAMLGVLAAAGSAVARLFPGRPPHLVMELPPLRLPAAMPLFRKTGVQIRAFAADALPVFFAGSLALALLDAAGILPLWSRALEPLTAGWLGLPPAAAPALIMGFLRRDFGAAGLAGLPLTGPQALVAAVTMTLFVPCAASLLAIAREHGWPPALAIWTLTFAAAILVGGTLARLLS